MTFGESIEFLLHHPLFGLLLTLLAFECGKKLYEKSGRNPLLQPILVAVLIVIAVLTLSGVNYESYFKGASLIHSLLGPAVVALAYPMYEHSGRIRQMFKPIMLTIPVAATIVTVVAIGSAWIFGGDQALLMTLAPKTATTAIAILVSEAIGGIPALTAVFVILTGIAGAVAGPAILARLNVTNHAVMGLSMGLCSHAVGTSRALEISEECGAFSALAMSLTGCFIAVTVPFLA